MVVRLAAPGRRALVHAHLAPPGPLPAGPDRIIDAEAAIGAAAKALGPISLRRPATARRVVWPAAAAYRAWLVDLPLNPLPLTLRAVVHAGTGRTTGWTRLDRSLNRAEVYETNPVTSDLADVELPWLLPDSEVLEGLYADVARCRVRDGECRQRRTALADADGDFRYPPDDDDGSLQDPFAEVSAYWHVNRIRGVFRELGLPLEALPGLQVWVNLADMDNAAYSPAEPMLLLGQGERDFAYDGDIVYHEYTHGVVSVTAELQSVSGGDEQVFDYLPGALNEGLADQFSTALSGNPRLGEYAGGYGLDGEVRTMEGDARCPDDQIGEEHQDSQPWAQALWEVLGTLGQERFFTLSWSVLTTLLPDSGPADAAVVLQLLAEEELPAADATAIAAALEGHGLERCRGVVKLGAGGTHTALAISSDDLTQGELAFEMPAHLQFSVEVERAGSEILIDKAVQCPRECPQATWIRRGRPVAFTFGPEYILEAEEAEVIRNERHTVFSADRAGTWYLATSNAGPLTFLYTLTVQVRPPPRPEPDVGGTTGDAGEQAGAGDTGGASGPPGSGGGVGDGPPPASGCDCKHARLGAAGRLASLLVRRR